MSSYVVRRAVSFVLVGSLVYSPPFFAFSDESAPGDPPYQVASAVTNPFTVDATQLMAEADSASMLNLEDLGFSKSDTSKDSSYQKLLNRRTKMLKIHQILGLTTGVAMALALSKASGTGAKGDAGRDAREDHEKYGIATGLLYFTTAGFSIFAPEVPNEKKSGRTKLHIALAFIHFPAMVGTMILGIRDKKKLDRGEDPSGLKASFASTAAVAFYTSLAVMVIPFGGKGDHK